MNKSLITGIGFGVVAAASVAGIAGGHLWQDKPRYAQVLNVTPIKNLQRTPHQVCSDVQVQHRRPVQDENRLAGSVLGAVAGGVLGHQLGGGKGRSIATVAGALAGGYAGNQAQQGLQNNDTYSSTHRRCRTVYDNSEQLQGYDVTYQIGEEKNKIRMNNDPGSRIPLDSNGRLIINQG